MSPLITIQDTFLRGGQHLGEPRLALNLLYNYLNYFSIAVICRNDQSNLLKKVFLWETPKDISYHHGGDKATRHGAGAVAESLHHLHMAERANWEWSGLLKPQSMPMVTDLLQYGHVSESFSNISISWGPNIQIYVPMGIIHTQTTTVTKDDLVFLVLLPLPPEFCD